MKKIFLILLLLVPTLGFAAGDDRSIIDLIYMPPENQVYGSLSASSHRVMYDLYSISGGVESPYYSTTVVATSTKAEVGYGLTSYLSLGVQAEYFFNRTTDTSIKIAALNGLTLKTESEGLVDPAAIGHFRLTDQKSFPIIAQIDVAYSPSTMKKKEASVDIKGTEGRGGSITQVGLNVGRKFDSIQGALGVTRILYSDRESESQTSNSKTTTSGGDITRLSAQLLLGLTEQIFLLGTYIYEATDESRAIATGSSNPSITETQKNHAYGFGLRLHPVKETVAIEFLGTMGKVDTFNVNSITGNYVVKDYSHTTFTVGALFQY